MMNRAMIAALSFLLAGAVTWPAPAQDPMTMPPEASPPEVAATQPAALSTEDEPAADRPLLAGPRVEPGAMGDAATSFGARRRPTPPVPLNRWRRALSRLSITADQRREIASLVEVFVQAQREFERTYGEEFRTLRDEIRQSRQARRDVPQSSLQRFAKIQAQAPNLPAMQLEVWAVLTSEQQDRMRTALSPPAEPSPRGQADRADRDGPG